MNGCKMKYKIREQNELKPSGLHWIDYLPKDWEKASLKYILNYIIGSTPSTSKDKYFFGNNIWVSISDIKDKYISDAKQRLSDEAIIDCNIKKVPKGSLLYSFKLSVGQMSFNTVDLYTNEAIASFLDNENVNLDFWYYALGRYLIEYSNENIYGAKLLNQDLIKNARLLVPSKIEQQKIANFLDEKSKIFDEAISKKEQLISKLELAKQSLISEVVTGKLKVVEQNSKLQTIKREKKELKLSGVEWLGDIPKDWQVKKSKYLFEIRKRIAGTLDFDVLSITQKGIKIKDIETGGGQLSMDYSKYQIVNIGDFAMNHMDLLTGFVDIAKVQGVTSPDYRVFSLIDKNSDSNFYLYLFQMGYKNQIFFAFGQGSSQLGRWRFPTEEFNKFYFPYPSLEEQQKISKYLDEKLIHFDNTIEKTKQTIKKLKEAKEALISQAVTGKIEVL